MIILAIIRITEILINERIFMPLREAVGIYHNAEGTPIGRNEEHPLAFFGGMLECFSCTSVWVTIFLIALLKLYRNLGEFFVTVFGVNKLVMFVKRFI